MSQNYVSRELKERVESCDKLGGDVIDALMDLFHGNGKGER